MPHQMFPMGFLPFDTKCKGNRYSLEGLLDYLVTGKYCGAVELSFEFAARIFRQTGFYLR